METSLCAPGRGLGCIACCPPIRPPGYDHYEHRRFLSREFMANRAAHLSGELPAKPIIGFTCPGLGFLDPKAGRAGCLYHPAHNQGRDLRVHTGYAEKCGREFCLAARAFAELKPGAREPLVDLCAGMDSFSFSSQAQNPVMRLLEFGPASATLAAGRAFSLAEMGAWSWLGQCPPAWGWLWHLAAEVDLPARVLGHAQAARRLEEAANILARELGPRPPMETGEPLDRVCGLWEARFWRLLSGRRRARPGELASWRQRALIAVDGLKAGLL